MLEFLQLVDDSVLERLPNIKKVEVGLFDVRLN